MKSNKLNLILGAMVALTMGGTGFAEERAAFPQFVRPLGMGGAFTAVADDNNAFSFNPAGMVQRTGAEVSFLEIALGGSSDLKEAVDYLSDHEDELTNLDNIATADPTRANQIVNDTLNTFTGLNPRFYVAGDVATFVSGPRFMGMPLHVGFGALFVVDGRFNIGPGTPFPTVSYSVDSDMVIPLSLAKRFDAPYIPGKIGVGLTGKLIRRAQVKQDNLNVAQLDNLDVPDPAIGKGIGSDLGLLYQPTDRFNVGLMVRDFLGTKISYDRVDAENGIPAQPERDTVIRPRTNIGVALTPERLLWILPTGNRLTLAADVRDILDKDKHIFFENGFRRVFGQDMWKQVHLGAEYKYWFLRLRGGAYQGYPSFGLGVDLPVLKVDYAFYSQELGARAGDLRQENHVISLGFKFGTNYTETRDRIKKGSESKEEQKMAVPEKVSTPVVTPAEPVPANDVVVPNSTEKEH